MTATDLFALTRALVDIPSVSHHETAIADFVEARLENLPGLDVTRVGDNVVARTCLGRPARVLLAGHLDTVPPAGNERARIEGTTLHGLGAADMKAGVAVLLDLAADATGFAYDTTFAFYVCEEVSREFSGLLEIERHDPRLLEADAAVLCEPTGGAVEAGCQGVVRAAVTVAGVRAHSARPWRGTNAIHRLAPVLARVAAFVERRPVLDGCEYRETLQAVGVSGGVAANVVPDEARVALSHRFAPDRDATAAFAALAAYLAPVLDAGAGDRVVLEDESPSAPPSLTHPVLASLLEASGEAARAKLGWTDVAFFAERGVPATNFGPGDPQFAHRADERVEAAELLHAREVLGRLLEA